MSCTGVTSSNRIWTLKDQICVTCPQCHSAAKLWTFSLIKMNIFINKSIPTQGIVLQTSSICLILILLLHPSSHPPEPSRNQSPPLGDQTLSPQTSPKPHPPLCSFVLTLHQTTLVTPMIQKLLQILMVLRLHLLTKCFPRCWCCASELCPGPLVPLIHNAL